MGDVNEKNDKLQFLKNNVKASFTVVALGFALTLGYAKGCTVQVGQDPAAAGEKPAVPAAVVPAPATTTGP